MSQGYVAGATGGAALSRKYPWLAIAKPPATCWVRFRRKSVSSMLLFFFFQAEDGIRDSSVTGVQTCALPILLSGRAAVGVFSGTLATFTDDDPDGGSAGEYTLSIDWGDDSTTSGTVTGGGGDRKSVV